MSYKEWREGPDMKCSIETNPPALVKVTWQTFLHVRNNVTKIPPQEMYTAPQHSDGVFNMKITLYTVSSYVQKHKYINISHTKINIFSFFLFKSLLYWLSLHRRGVIRAGGCSIPVFLYLGIVASTQLKTMLWKPLHLLEREEEMTQALWKDGGKENVPENKYSATRL